MLMARVVLTILLLSILAPARAGLHFDIKIVHQKGIDKGLTLISELHSFESLVLGREVRLKMKNGVSVYLRATFIESVGDEQGPSSTVSVLGHILSSSGEVLKFFGDDNILIELGQTHTISYDSEGQLIKVTMTPRML